MKRILFVISQLYKGGAETSLVNLLNHLDYAKYSVDLLILNQSPVKDAVSLIDRVNKNVVICDAYKEYQSINVLDRLRAKVFYRLDQKGAYYFTALDFVRNKHYDWAFFVGEWYSPSFVAYEVNASIKAAWIHNDLSEAEYFDAKHYFYFKDMFDYFIFVSKHSLESSVKAFPFIKNKAITIYNINDVEYIKKRSQEPLDFAFVHKKPILLTCANFRAQKNHFRQVQVMKELKDRGVNFTWLNIGATSDENLVEAVKAFRDENDLTNDFLILGPKENPYNYMMKADAIAVLSDYESWSMVITEAKILGKPVISTKTSGAIEQISDNRTGVLTDFNISNIADKMEEFLKDKTLQKTIKNNIRNFDNTNEIVDDFEKLILEGKPSKNNFEVLYIIDDINYVGGAHVATKLQIKEFLKEGKKIAIYSSSVPGINVRNELSGVVFYSFNDFKEDKIFNKRLCYCIFDKYLSFQEKTRKLKYTVSSYLKMLDYEKMILPHISSLFSQFNTVCVMSESSAYRRVVANSGCTNKIQWIHTDYCDWKNKNEWIKRITASDSEIYAKFSCIVVLTESIRKQFINLYPHLDEKVIVNKNLIPIDDIRKRAEVPTAINKELVNFVTVGRIDFPKAYPRLISILADLKEMGYRFHWTIIGGGNEFGNVKNLIENFNLSKEVTMTGPLNNPFVELKKADVFGLLSDYEGLPNTIYESFILGVPVLATKVGGVPTQVIDNENGWLVENNSKAIRNKIEYILMNYNEIGKIKEKLKAYSYDNHQIMSVNKKIFKFSDDC